MNLREKNTPKKGLEKGLYWCSDVGTDLCIWTPAVLALTTACRGWRRHGVGAPWDGTEAGVGGDV
jgi:hypothetical protein